MAVAAVDSISVIVYFCISFGISFYYTKKASASTEAFFLGGQNMPWYLAGTSMVASTFAADTPLAVTEIIFDNGISGNWVWWTFGFGHMLAVFFFSRMWRRSGVMTDVEFVEFRYSGSIGRFLRGFKACFYGLMVNLVVLGWVNKAMTVIFQTLWPEDLDSGLSTLLTFTLMLLAAISTSMGGLTGSIMTDFFQFGLAMGCCILLAGMAVTQLGGLEGGGYSRGMEMITTDWEGQPVTDFAPSFSALPERGDGKTLVEVAALFKAALASVNSTLEAEFSSVEGRGAGLAAAVAAGEVKACVGANKALVMTPIAFLARIMVQWWSTWYPGAEPGGGGYIAQRMMAAKNETHAFLAMLWFSMAHYALRSWPWVIVALVAIKKYPYLGQLGCAVPSLPLDQANSFDYPLLHQIWRATTNVSGEFMDLSTNEGGLTHGLPKGCMVFDESLGMIKNNGWESFDNSKARPDCSKGSGFIHIMSDTMPAGALGLLLAAFMAAYMSTITTQLVWGVSYFVGDFWRRFIQTNKSETYYVWVTRATNVFLVIVSLGVGFLMDNVADGWTILISSSAGVGFPLLLRWYWWRVNGWTELTGILFPVFLNMLSVIMKELGYTGSTVGAEFLLSDPTNLFFNSFLTIVACLFVMMMTPPDTDEKLDAFFVKCRPAGPGWAKFRARHPEITIETSLPELFLGWAAAVLCVYCALFTTGSAIFGRWEIFVPVFIGLLSAGGFLAYWLPKILAKDADDFGNGNKSGEGAI